MNDNYRNQNEIMQARRDAKACEELAKRTPDGAFEDDPRANGYDQHGKTYHRGNAYRVISDENLTWHHQSRLADG